MGTWSLPDNLKLARELQELLSKPLPMIEESEENNEDTVQSRLYNLMGDDSLFDKLDSMPIGKDARILIIDTLERWLKDGSWTKDMEPKAIETLHSIVEMKNNFIFS